MIRRINGAKHLFDDMVLSTFLDKNGAKQDAEIFALF